MKCLGVQRTRLCLGYSYTEAITHCKPFGLPLAVALGVLLYKASTRTSATTAPTYATFQFSAQGLTWAHREEKRKAKQKPEENEGF